MLLYSLLFGCSEYDIQDVGANPPSIDETEEDKADSTENRVEVCDGYDNNNNGYIDEGFSDNDFDGIADCVDEEEVTA